MCRKTITLLSLILILGLASTLEGVTYYVSPDGNDNNSGTSPSEAWKTIDKVNTVDFDAGDGVLFEGGTTTTGTLSFDSADSGTSANPITVGSYGTGRATISSPAANGLYASDCGGYLVKDLILVGSGTDVGVGLSFKNNQSSGTLQYVYIDNVDVGGYKRGMYMRAKEGGKYNDIQVTNTDFHDNGLYGATTSGEWPPSGYALTNMYFGDCTF
ncbi:MAG: right-handed parallel beta-helix repeat-containing protein, partial [Planctomycetota bacterium]